MGKGKKLDRPVLAEGEMTGHAHVLDVEDVDVFLTEAGVREFEVASPTIVKHEEHKPIVLDPKKWCSDVVRETDPFEGERRVRD